MLMEILLGFLLAKVATNIVAPAPQAILNEATNTNTSAELEVLSELYVALAPVLASATLGKPLPFEKFKPVVYRVAGKALGLSKEDNFKLLDAIISDHAYVRQFKTWFDTKMFMICNKVSPFEEPDQWLWEFSNANLQSEKITYAFEYLRNCSTTLSEPSKEALKKLLKTLKKKMPKYRKNMNDVSGFLDEISQQLGNVNTLAELTNSTTPEDDISEGVTNIRQAIFKLKAQNATKILTKLIDMASSETLTFGTDPEKNIDNVMSLIDTTFKFIKGQSLEIRYEIIEKFVDPGIDKHLKEFYKELTEKFHRFNFIVGSGWSMPLFG